MKLPARASTAAIILDSEIRSDSEPGGRHGVVTRAHQRLRAHLRPGSRWKLQRTADSDRTSHRCRDERQYLGGSPAYGARAQGRSRCAGCRGYPVGEIADRQKTQRALEVGPYADRETGPTR